MVDINNNIGNDHEKREPDKPQHVEVVKLPIKTVMTAVCLLVLGIVRSYERTRLTFIQRYSSV